MCHLKEIDIIRCRVILLVIAVHTLAPFTNAWTLPPCFKPNEFLWWLGKFCYSGMLETFVFISGYVFAIKEIPNKLNNKVSFTLKKVKRLYLPCIVFGIIMSIIFSKSDIQTKILNIINGSYHLWFLPMLLWCFIFEIFIIPIINKYKILVLLFLAILPYPSLPLFFNNALFFLFFFHLGGFVYKKRESVVNFINKNIIKMLLWYVVLFIISTLWCDYVYNLSDINILIKAILILSVHFSRLLCALIAVMIYYCIGYKLQNNDSIYNLAKIVAKYSMGIYLFQELVLRLIYYKMNICLDNNLLSLCLIYLVTFLSSLGMTYVFSKNRVTKKIVL